MKYEMSGALPPLREFLSEQRGKRVHFETGRGNNGDALMILGGRKMLADTGVELVREPAGADLIVFRGGGFTDTSLGNPRLREYSLRHSHVPMVIFPSSFFFTANSVEALLAERRAPLFVYAREGQTHETLNRARLRANVRVGVDHDLAFHLRQSQWLSDLQASCRDRHVLIVERGDAEAATSARQAPVGPAFKRYVPLVVKRQVKKILLYRGTRTEFVSEALAVAHHRHEFCRRLPVRIADVSRHDVYTFDEFATAIAHAAVVVTTRLHVGILAALLGKPTILKVSGSPLPKVLAIYEYSMREMNNVSLM